MVVRVIDLIDYLSQLNTEGLIEPDDIQFWFDEQEREQEAS